jgi:hypothetical protein
MSYNKICRNTTISNRTQVNSSVSMYDAMIFLLVYVPQTQAVALYQAYLASGTVTCPPFVANQSSGEITSDDYCQQMMISRMERQELEEQEQEWLC